MTSAVRPPAHPTFRACPVALSPTALPRAAALTDALLAPPDATEPPVDEAFAGRLGDRLARALAEHRPPGGTRKAVTGWSLRTAADAGVPDATAFRWTPRTTRRALGIAAVRACVAGEARTPLEAVRLVSAGWLRGVEGGDSGPRSAAAWLASVPAGGRAVVEAEAATWATALFGALEWDRLGPADVGGPDRWWDAPGGGAALRGRADVRAVAGGHPVLLCVGNGRPRPSSRAELLLPALVEVLRRPWGPSPARVVGWWPASGRVLVLPVSAPALTDTARLVAQVVAAPAGAAA